MHQTQEKGMTLLEVSMVLLLLSLFLGLAIPNFSLMTEPPLRLEAKRLAHLITTLKNESVMSGVEQRLLFSTKDNSFVAERKGITAKKPWLAHPIYPDAFHLPQGVRFQNLTNQIPDESQFGFRKIRFESLFGEEFQINFDPSGLVDICQIELATSTEMIEVKVQDILGKVSLSGIRGAL